MRIFTDKNCKPEELNRWLLQRTPEEVVVIPFVPTDIPVVAGVVCGEIIPPFCHLALLCQSRKTPCCYGGENCVEIIKKAGLSNVVANGAIGRTGFILDGSDNMNIQRAVPPKVDIPKPNISVTNLIDLSDKQATDITIVGAKAAQLANVEATYSQPIFKGTFVIPFHHYEKHVYQNHTIVKVIQATNDNMKKKEFNFNEFTNVQDQIRNFQVNDELVNSVIERIKQHNMTPVILRSSTNAEDLTGFNGAGLYESVTLKGSASSDPKQVGAAIKKVWASVWSPA